MQIRNRIQTSKPSNEFEGSLEQELLSYSRELAASINKGLYFQDNFNAEELSFTTDGSANTEFSAAHTLKRTPTRFFVVDTDKGGVLYKGTTTWTNTTVYFKCSVASAAMKVYIY